jgi:[ribosomal protein S5]-alanine N-acetyltransferase
MIQTKRLRIRPFEPSDCSDLFEYLSKAETFVFEPGAPITLDQAKDLAAIRSQGRDFLAVVLKNGYKMIGHIYFARLEPFERLTWELGYIFNPLYHRRVYATEAAAAVVSYGFRELKAHRVMARCNPQNVASWKLLEKIGFVREAHFRQYGFRRRDADGNPIWNDVYEYSMVEEAVPGKA